VSVEIVIGVAGRRDGVDGVAGQLKAAELALHEAKDARVESMRFVPALDRFDPERVVLAGELRRAIANDELFLVYQPKIDLQTGLLRGVEALVRWRHPRRGILAPINFIPVAESTTIIHSLTNWVVDRAVRQMHEWSGPQAPLSVAVNISARDLRDPTLPDRLLRSLVEHEVAPHRLTIEITESAIIADPQRANTILRRLHDAGITISMDDFGQGATSLTSLAQLTLDEIKIDMAFVAALGADAASTSIVEWVIEIGHRLGLRLVAEGIESEYQAEKLTAMGCDTGQGYLFGRPMTADDLEQWIAERQSKIVAPAPN
jgi:EAL domain-containing protein (putative c-di-GMP-specific phosphodiesterase class I)